MITSRIRKNPNKINTSLAPRVKEKEATFKSSKKGSLLELTLLEKIVKDLSPRNAIHITETTSIKERKECTIINLKYFDWAEEFNRLTKAQKFKLSSVALSGLGLNFCLMVECYNKV